MRRDEDGRNCDWRNASLLWNAKPENRHLPSALEWANIRLLTKKKDWTAPQRKLMRKVQTRLLVRGVLILFIGLAAGVGVENIPTISMPRR